MSVKFKPSGKNISFEFKGNKMLLKREPSKNRVGEVVNLYQKTPDGDRFIKIVGWLQDDGKQGWENEKTIINNGLTTIENCKFKVIPYLEKLLS